MAHKKVRLTLVHGSVQAVEDAINELLPDSHQLVNVLRLGPEHDWLVVWQERGEKRVEPATAREAYREFVDRQDRAVLTASHGVVDVVEPPVVPARAFAEEPTPVASMVDRLKFWRRA
jgi:hypothetical protein